MATASYSSAAGVTHEPGIAFDYYTGTKNALIAAGAAEPAWFPTEPQRDKQGRVKRTFHVQGEHGTIELHERRGRWELYVPIADAERQRRDGESDRALQVMRANAAQVASRLAVEKELETIEQRTLKASSKEPLTREAVKLAPFVDGSISEFERHLLRVYRTLSDEGRAMICSLAENYLASDSERVHRKATERPSKGATLRLVVDNTPPANG